MTEPGRKVRVIGAGRAGGAIAAALAEAGWQVQPFLTRSTSPESLHNAAMDVDLVLIATPDAAVAEVAAAIKPSTAVVAHMAGSLGLNVLAPHRCRGALHPLVALPSAEIGAQRLRSGCWFAVAGDPLMSQVVADLGGRFFEVAETDRARYHAAAVVASNHLVALLGQAERIASTSGVPFDAFMDLVKATVDNVAELGPAAALTGPAARGDSDTLARHLAAISPAERPAYRALSQQASRLAAQQANQLAAGQSTAGVDPQTDMAPPCRETTIAGLRQHLHIATAANLKVGFVPTMGFLHAGHCSLIEQARTDNDLVVVSIFVNPLQFGEGEDYDDYPRNLENDIAMCAAAGVDVVFTPDVTEMYPLPLATTINPGPLADVLCGANRAGHFQGVATVVAKLLSIIGPCRAYFGEKDFQQLTIVRRIVSDLSLPVQVVGCPTVREADGLALSSRNAYLSIDERVQAPVLWQALNAGAELVNSGERHPEALQEKMAAVIATAPLAQIDYTAALPAATLVADGPLRGEVRLLVAARFGAARLIDNIGCYAAPSKLGTGSGCFC